MRGCEQIPWLYDGLMAFCDAFGLGRWREWLVSGARGRTLELGCGTGRNLPRYDPSVRVVGLDPSWDALLKARRRAPAVPLVAGRAEALPFRGGAFEVVVSGLVFCSVPDPAAGLAEVKRVLATDGRLRMLEHVRARGRRAARLQDFLQPFWTRVTGGCHPNRDTETTVLAAGFEIEAFGRRAQRELRRFSARPVPSSPPPAAGSGPRA